MSFEIEDEDVIRRIHEIAAMTGESVEDVVFVAVRERLEQLKAGASQPA